MIPKGSAALYKNLPKHRDQPGIQIILEKGQAKDRKGTNISQAQFEEKWEAMDEINSFIADSPQDPYRTLTSKSKKLFKLLEFKRHSNLVIWNASIDRLHFSGQRLEVKNCKLGQLTLFGTHQDHQTVLIENCVIGELRLDRNVSQTQAEFRNCRILNLRFEDSDDRKPFDLVFDNRPFEMEAETGTALQEVVKAADSQIYYAPQASLQSYRDLHNWAQRYGMSNLAHLARGTELGLEYTTSEPGLEKFALLVWKFACDYGLRPQKALFWLFISTAVLWIALWCCGTTSATSAPQWVKDLNDWSRALVAALSNLVFPYAGISPRSLVIPSNIASATLMLVHGITTIALLLFIGFSLRRRFKFN
ncbi:hypothetical protein C8N31_109139 [Sulfitobacter mediterraneus]|uniref:Uncharacterized protein n=2 Tax=Sulfitobacter mediterraneus TaxID=83219 RepID=A0A2T6CC33_9RHOB|nr:hypothetical protein Z950_2854 [Sulfitobacter mediterraneus KCTC 32188]PTX73053.1 hypothetical protein C8N31_109139 [Sulfitobacter mediterraneus]